MCSRILINIDIQCDEVRREIYGEVLHQSKKETSTRLSDGVVVRQWCKSKCHHHIKEPRTFCKARAWGVQLTTPQRRSLTKVRDEFVSRHSLETIITRVVRMRYPRYMQYLGYKIWGSYDTCTSNEHSKQWHRGIDTMYIGVKLLYNHNRTSQRTHIERSPTPSPNDGRERSVGKVRQNDLAFRMNAASLEVL